MSTGTIIWIAAVAGVVVIATEAQHLAQLLDMIARDFHALARVSERHAAGWRGYKRAVAEEGRMQNPQQLRRIK